MGKRGRNDLALRLALRMSALMLGAPTKKPLTISDQGLHILVAWGGIEPPTRGFSIQASDY